MRFEGDDSVGSAVLMVKEAIGINDIYPTRGPIAGGNMVTIYVQQSSELTFTCKFGDQKVDAFRQDDNALTCMVPPADRSTTVALVLVANGADVSSHQQALYEYHESAIFHYLYPSSGPILGGTIVRVAGRFSANLALSCSFGEGELFAAQHVTSSLIHCVTPMRNHSDNSAKLVVISSRGHEFPLEELAFRFEEVAHVHKVQPAVFSLEAQVVTVFGKNFVQTSSTRCLFGRSISRHGIWESSTKVLCQASLQRTGNFSLSISSNGIDFSPSNITIVSRHVYAIESISPTAASSAGGAIVTIVPTAFCRSTRCTASSVKAPTRWSWKSLPERTHVMFRVCDQGRHF